MKIKRKYTKHVINKGWIKNGQRLNVLTEFGNKEPCNKGLKGLHISSKTEFKKGDNSGNKNINWKGDNVGYHALHRWVEKHFGVPIQCQSCSSQENVQWANIDYIYTRCKHHWKQLCSKCHHKHDRSSGKWGEATRRFNL